MGTTYLLRADLTLDPARRDAWLAMPLDGIPTPSGGWIDEEGSAELESASAVLAALADAADHFSYVVEGDRIALRAFFSHDWLLDCGPSLARALAAFALAGGRGSAVLGDAATRRGAVTELAPGKPPKTSAMRAGVLEVSALTEASQSPATGFAAEPAARPARSSKKTAAKKASPKPPAKTAKKSAARR